MDWYAGKKEEAENTKDSSSAMHDDDTANRVEVLNNRIYFYSEVTRTKVLTLNKKLTSLNISLANQVNTLDLNDLHANIRLYINSFGGSVFAGFSAVDYIKKSKIPVETIIDGCAASAATMMSIVAQRRYMNEHAFMLIHQLSSACWGTYEEMKDDMKNNDLLMKTIKQI